MKSLSKCTCQVKHDVELRSVDNQVQVCLRMLAEIIKLKPGFHHHFSLIDALDRAQAGQRVTRTYETPSATLRESLTHLD